MDAQSQVRTELIEFLSTVTRPGVSVADVDDGENLIDAGIIDSLVMVQIIMELETRYGLNLASAGVDPGELVSINGIIGAIARQG